MKPLKAALEPLALRFTQLLARKGIKAKKTLLTRKIAKTYRQTIAYGPLRGTRLSTNSRWGARDRSSMFLGLYEKEVLEHLTLLAPRYHTLIDIGAGDGYYAVGCVRANLFEHAIAFEISESGRNIVRDTARLNDVSKQIQIHGAATLPLLQGIALRLPHPPVLLIDIEGGEFDLITAEFLDLFRHSSIIIEIHEHLVSDGEKRYAALLQHCRPLFSLREIRTGPRDLSSFPELETLSDDERWLMCSEGRRHLGKWLFLEPL